MSCLPSDALSHFQQREQELLALNQELEHKKVHALAEASSAVREVESSSIHSRVFVPPQDDAPVAAPAADSGTAAAATVTEAGESVLAAVRGSSSSSRPPTGSALDAGSTEPLHATIRFQNARIIALQEELDKTVAELTARDSEATQLRQDLKQATDDKRRLQKTADSAEQLQERMKKQISAGETKVQELERERSELLKEKDNWDVQRRKHDAERSSMEARLNRLTEDLEKHKTAAKDSNNQDRDRAVADRRETDRLTTEVRKLERQRTELVSAFKKQMKLIDVLKRQRAHVEAARVLSFTEDEFIRILELGEKLGE